MRERKKRLGIALAANDAFVKHFTTALTVPPGVLRDVAQYVNTENGIEITDTEQLVTIWRPSGLSNDDLSNVYNVLEHLFEEGVKKSLEPDALLEELAEFAAERGIAGFAERREALRLFLEPKSEYVRRRQFVDYTFGVVPTLDAISGVVQLRAAFTEKRSTEIIGYVPTVQIRLRADYADAKEEELFVFQVDEPGLEKLLKFLREYQAQLVALKQSVEGKLEIYTRPEKEDKL